jgi:septal ring factor EnvC (AmiA/AmiB activator)
MPRPSALPSPAALFAVAMLTALSLPLLTASVAAEESVILNIEETGEALSQTETALDESKRAKAKLDAQVTEIKQDVLRIRREMVEGAAEAQDLEAQISALETNLQELTQRRAEKRDALAQRRDELTQTFAALQRISRTPPDLLIFMPASIQEISRARLLLGAVAGELDARTASLGGELQNLARMGEQIFIQHELIDVAAERLEAQRARLGVLLTRKTNVQDRTEAQHDRAEALVSRLADEAETLQELLGQLEQERFNRPEYVPEPLEAAAAVELLPVESVRSVTLQLDAPPTSREKSGASGPVASLSVTPPATPAPETQTDKNSDKSGEIAPKASSDRKKWAKGDEIGQVAALAPVPKVRPHVRAARGAFAMPARGKLISRFNETTVPGLSTKGIIIETRALAQIVAPFDGRVAFAGPFREYGLLLIIDHGEGYHTLLAGMGRIDARLHQHVLAGEPVGVMGPLNGEKPKLYVELRKKGYPINPLPWLAAESSKVSG